MTKYKRIYICDQKKDCRTSTACGKDCFMTSDREHKACALDFDEKENKFIPVGHLEELRGYILEKEQEGNI